MAAKTEKEKQNQKKKKQQQKQHGVLWWLPGFLKNASVLIVKYFTMSTHSLIWVFTTGPVQISRTTGRPTLKSIKFFSPLLAHQLNAFHTCTQLKEKERGGERTMHSRWIRSIISGSAFGDFRVLMTSFYWVLSTHFKGRLIFSSRHSYRVCLLLAPLL